MFAQFMHRRMIIAAHLVGERQIGRIKDAGLGAEQLQQARGLLCRQARKGALAQRPIEKQDSRGRPIIAESRRRPRPDGNSMRTD